MRPALPAPRTEYPGARSGELEAMVAIVSDLIRAGHLRPPAAPLPWPALVLWFKRAYAPGLRTPALSAVLLVALGPRPHPPAGPAPPELRQRRSDGRGPWAAPTVRAGPRRRGSAPAELPQEARGLEPGVGPAAGRLVYPAELDGDAMLARLTSHSCRALRAAPAGSFEGLPDDVLETACAYGSLLDWLSLRAAARRFARVGEPFVRRCAAALARADLRPVHTLVVWAVRLYGPWQSVRAQRLANRLAAARAGFDRGALFDLWARGQWNVWFELAPGGGPAQQATIRALRLQLAAARSAAQGWLTSRVS